MAIMGLITSTYYQCCVAMAVMGAQATNYSESFGNHGNGDFSSPAAPNAQYQQQSQLRLVPCLLSHGNAQGLTL